jgi:hypothetical protein
VATGRVIEFSSEKLRKLRDEICREHGFSPLSHQFHVFGLSPEAAAKGDGSGGDDAGAADVPTAAGDKSAGAPLPAPPFGPDNK